MSIAQKLITLSLMAVTIGRADETPIPEEVRSKAAQGDPSAQLDLAIRYRDGTGVPRDPVEAMKWAHLAADQGHAGAMDFIGWMFFRGTEVTHQPGLAAAYFAAAARESPQAAWNLGQCFFAGQGVEHDIPKALDAWKMAAAKGHGRAASTAAMVLLAGDGIPADPQAARRLAERAAELNDRNGHVVLGEICWQAGDLEKAAKAWTTVASMSTTGATGHPEQSGDEMAAQQGADLLKLMEMRKRKNDPGKFVFVPVPHLHQGWNNCGATSCAMFSRAHATSVGSWDFKKLCPSPLGTGTDWADLVAAAKKTGQDWKLITFEADDEGFAKATAFARRELDAGRALVIDFKYIGPQYPGGEAGHTLLLTGYLAEENLYILCNPAIATPGLQLISEEHLKHFWRSDGYSETSGGMMSRPAIIRRTDEP